MHEEVLDSAAATRCSALRPERIIESKRDGDALAGGGCSTRFEVRGVSHPLALDFEGTRTGERATIHVRFDVPWVAWGLPDPSNAILRVDDVLAVDVEAKGTLAASPWRRSLVLAPTPPLPCAAVAPALVRRECPAREPASRCPCRSAACRRTGSLQDAEARRR